MPVNRIVTIQIRVPDSIKKEVAELRKRVLNGELDVPEVMKYAAMSGPLFYQYLIRRGIEAIPYTGWVKK